MTRLTLTLGALAALTALPAMAESSTSRRIEAGSSSWPLGEDHAYQLVSSRHPLE